MIAYALAALLIYIVYIIFNQFTYWKRRKMLHLDLVPFVGNNYQVFFGIESFAIHSQNLYKKLPGARYYGMFDFRMPTVLIKDPEIIREICVKSFNNFTDHLTFVTEEMDPIAGRMLFSLSGQRWKDFRSTLSPTFTAARMKYLFELVDDCARNFVQYFLEHPKVIFFAIKGVQHVITAIVRLI